MNNDINQPLLDALKKITGTVSVNGKEYYEITEQDLQQFIDARQKSKPVGWFIAPNDYQGYTQVSKEYEATECTIPLYTSPPDAVKDALEEAATKIAEQMPLNCDEEHHAYRFSDDCKAMAWDIAHAIRALIQPKKEVE